MNFIGLKPLVYVALFGVNANVLAASVQNDQAITSVNVPVIIPVLDNDEGNWAQASFTQGTNGIVSPDSGGLKYTPTSNFGGTDTFSYTVSELGGPDFVALVTVTINTIEVTDDLYGTDINKPISLALLDNDIGNWASGSFTQPENGIVQAGGSGVNYQPQAGFKGIDTFSYTLTDVAGATASATVSISVNSADPKDQTLPLFKCEAGQQFCNLAEQSSLGVESLGYGRGAAIVDVNGDGLLDIFQADCDDRSSPGFGVSKFFINQGDGTYLASSLGLSLTDTFATWSGGFGDYDNDGDPDLMLANGGYSGSSSLEFYENDVGGSGVFIRRTDSSGIGIVNNFLSHWWGVSWADYNQDGWLDVVVTRTEGSTVLFRNDAGAGFTDVTDSVGINTFFLENEDGKNPVWIDFDNDGDQDLYIAGFLRHQFWRNDSSNGFVDITDDVFTDPLPSAGTTPANAPSVFAALAEDFNQDGFDDLYLGRWTEQDLVMINNGAGGFSQFGNSIGIDALHTTRTELASPYENTMGLGTGDLQGDGFPDIIIGTGDPQRADKDIVYCNDGTSFSRCTELLFGGAVSDFRTRGHAPVFGDFDSDGKLDVFMNLGGHPEWDLNNNRDTREQVALLMNQNTNQQNSATIRLQGTTSNRDSIGAKLRVEYAGATRFYGIRSMQGFQAQNSTSIVIPFGANSSATVTAFWPSGSSKEITIANGDNIIVIEPN